MDQYERGVSAGPIEPADAPDAAPHARLNGARRATLSRLAALCGLALSGEAIAALAAPKKKPGARAAAPEILSAEELALTGVLAEMIIPQTDTPGALAVGAHRTIDHLLAVCALAPAQQAFKAGLARVDATATAQDGKRFAALSAPRQLALVGAMDRGQAPFGAEDQQFFRMLKQYTLFAYYTSEPGATRELAYLPVPGGYKGSVKLTKATRTWAL